MIYRITDMQDFDILLFLNCLGCDPGKLCGPQIGYSIQIVM